MGEREIIIADRDARYRSRMAHFFREEGYHVGTAETPDEVLALVLENQAAVLLLGNGFSSQISTSELIHLLKKCSRHLHIIMVSDEMTLSQARQVREEGIFYHALKPATAADTEELWQAVACAFEKHRASVLADPAPPQQGQSGGPGSGRLVSIKALTVIVALVAALMGAGYYFLAPNAANASHGSLTVMTFLGFCAVLIVSQLLPIFHIKLAPGRARQSQATPEITPRGGK